MLVLSQVVQLNREKHNNIDHVLLKNCSYTISKSTKSLEQVGTRVVSELESFLFENVLERNLIGKYRCLFLLISHLDVLPSVYNRIKK